MSRQWRSTAQGGARLDSHRARLRSKQPWNDEVRVGHGGSHGVASRLDLELLHLEIDSTSEELYGYIWGSN
ncbi:hypothetical protein NL676_032081 [Syzygium grande]|nr:hypothetical protein NL676_032081 [Syzygium grande]